MGIRVEGTVHLGHAGTPLLGDGAVLLEGPRIVAVASAGDLPASAGDRLIRAPEGGLIVPGFVDLLCYGGGGAGVAEAEPQAIAQLARAHAAHGTTSLFAGIESLPTPEAQRRVEAVVKAVANGLAPTVAGIHLEGPFLTPSRRGIHAAAALQRPEGEALRDAERLISAGKGLVRLITLACEQPGALSWVGSLVARGVTVSQGHSEATYDEAVAAMTAGAWLCTHLFNAMPPLGHRAPGLAGAFLSPPALARLPVASLIADGAHVAPAMVALAYRALGASALALMTDAMPPAAAAPGAAVSAQPQLFGGREVVVSQGALRARDDGTLVGSTLTMDAALANLATFTHESLAALVPTATATPARAARLLDRGALVAGARADLAILDPRGRVLVTIAGGAVIHEASFP